MDHLKIPSGAAHIRVPYTCTEAYDGGDFFGYLERKGWTEGQLLGRDDFGGRTDREVETFFQTWLYFGTLACFFKTQDVAIDASEFTEEDETDGSVIVTSAKLPDKIRQWNAAWFDETKHQSSLRGALKQAYAIAGQLHAFTNFYCGADRQVGSEQDRGESRAPALQPWPVSPEISLSLLALGHTLGAALEQVHSKLEKEWYQTHGKRLYEKPKGTEIKSWGTSPLLKSRLLEAGWCPLDVARYLEDVEIDGHYYLALKPYPYTKERHKKCDMYACRANTISEETYVTKHVQDGCICEHVDATADALKVIQGGGIPVVYWRSDSKELVVEDGSADHIPYVAVSHVWSDGLGNPRKDSLPRCQLERIQSYMDAIPLEAECRPISPLHFWMDTLCIPVAEEHHSLRKKAVQMMGQIYRDAEAVLVLDASIQQHVSLSSTNTEKAIAIYMSNWLHRLWTFQEGMFAKRRFFQMADGPLDMERFTDDSVDEQTKEEERGMSTSFQFAVRVSFTIHFVVLRDILEMIAMGLEDPNMMLFPPVCHALSQRTTTRLSDEAICGATIMGMDMAGILAVETRDVPDEVVAAKRMEEFLKQIGLFPPQIIFHHGKRLCSVGYRWAPKSLLGMQQRYIVAASGKPATFTPEEGLAVNFPAFIFRQGAPSEREKSVEILQKETGRRYRLQIFPEDDAGLPWGPNEIYAALMMRPISCAKHPAGVDAIIGVFKDPSPSKLNASGLPASSEHAIKIVCECRAWVETIHPSSQSELPVIEADYATEQQQWRIF